MGSIWQKVATITEIPSGQSTVVTIGDKRVAIFHREGSFHAIADECPHRGASLGEGDLEGSIVTCPWHGWQFDVTTGQSPINPAACVPTYPCKVEEGDVWVQIDISPLPVRQAGNPS